MPAWGGSAHVHKGVSPFEGKAGHKNSHCLLNKHDHGNLPCPHALLNFPKNKPGFFISVECGGSRQGPLPVKTGFDRNPGLAAATPVAASQGNCQTFSGGSLLRDFYIPDPLDHPPKSV